MARAEKCGLRAQGLIHLATDYYVVEDEDGHDVPSAECDQGTEAERLVCESVNAERTARQMGPLKMNPNLTAVAENYARQIYAYNQRSGRGLHLDPSSHHVNGELMDRLLSARVTFTQGGENLHSGSTTPESAVAHWMASPNHRQEILTPAYRKTGVGEYQGIWVQLFTD